MFSSFQFYTTFFLVSSPFISAESPYSYGVEEQKLAGSSGPYDIQGAAFSILVCTSPPTKNATKASFSALSYIDCILSSYSRL